MKKTHVVIPTPVTLHLFQRGASIRDPIALPYYACLIIPTPHKGGLYHFPDGEVYLRIPNLTGAKKVTVVHSGYPYPNAGLIELYMTLEIVRATATVKEIEIIFTSMPYARQDTVRQDGEVAMAEALIARLINDYGVSKITTIDAHFAGEKWVKKYPLVNVSALSILIDEARCDYGNDIFFITPDAGSARRTHIKGAHKDRHNSYEVSIDFGKEDLAHILKKKRVIGVVDDILSTGGTLEKFLETLRRKGVKSTVIALITHGVNADGVERVRRLYDHLYITNTINCPGVNVSVVRLLNTLI